MHCCISFVIMHKCENVEDLEEMKFIFKISVERKPQIPNEVMEEAV